VYYITCSRCSFVFYSGEKPADILKVLAKYGDKCPRCLRRLSLKPVNVEVRVRGGK